jgi:predicted ester cyclase
MNNSTLVKTFIEQVWNQQSFKLLDTLLHPDYRDNSLSSPFQIGKEGTIKWILNTGLSFEHLTTIEDQVTEGDKSIVKIKMTLKHVGTWRNIEATGISLDTTGYRFFKFKDGKIIEHLALIDGQTIENQLKNASAGCVIVK